MRNLYIILIGILIGLSVYASDSYVTISTNFLNARLKIGKDILFVDEPVWIEMELFIKEIKVAPEIKIEGLPDTVRIIEPFKEFYPSQYPFYQKRYFKGIIKFTQASELIFKPFFIVHPVSNDGEIKKEVFIAVRPEPVEVKVLALPDRNLPEKFSGLIGSLIATSTWLSTSCEVGSILTLEISLSGMANFSDIKVLPCVGPHEGIRIFEPQIIDISDSRYLIITQDIVPLNEGEILFKPIKLVYFNTTKKEFYEERIAIPKITVLPRMYKIQSKGKFSYMIYPEADIIKSIIIMAVLISVFAIISRYALNRKCYIAGICIVLFVFILSSLIYIYYRKLSMISAHVDDTRICYSAPYDRSARAFVLLAGEYVRILEYCGNWCLVTSQYGTGWIRKDFLKFVRKN